MCMFYDADWAANVPMSAQCFAASAPVARCGPRGVAPPPSSPGGSLPPLQPASVADLVPGDWALSVDDAGALTCP